jgi:hypothetical protein
LPLTEIDMKRIAIVLVAATPALAFAHHGWSEYDASTTLTLTGAIEQAGYEHPHGFVTMTADGKRWTAVLAPPSRMDNRGLSRDLLKQGATVTVVGYPNRTKPDEMRAERITAAGKTVELR